MLQRIAAAAVFCQSGIAVVSVTLIVEHHILNDGAIANGIPNDGLVFSAEVNGLGVATALDVKH